MVKLHRAQAKNIRRGQRPRIDIWLLSHLQVALASLGRLNSAPLATLMTSGVIGIALALPTGLYTILDNMQELSRTLGGTTSISLYLKHGIDDQQLTELASRLNDHESVTTVQIIRPEEALEEFKRLSGFSQALDTLEANPLPALLVIKPNISQGSAEDAEILLNELSQIEQVDFAQLDLQWVRRFHAITVIANRGVLILASILGLAVLLVAGNTIRLEIQNRYAEIEITKLIGGTDAFIRRPFLYGGLWYGLFGGIIAVFLVATAIWLLQGPISRLAILYESKFSLAGIGFVNILLLLAASALLGLIGSWIAVARHLSKIEPE